MNTNNLICILLGRRTRRRLRFDVRTKERNISSHIVFSVLFHNILELREEIRCHVPDAFAVLGRNQCHHFR